eukprot:NODE_92_length_21718_cov_0.361950.p4 type:complete len:740 gc:universal NODE_92_length_21718_cov_0.361950:8999-11218(+)
MDELLPLVFKSDSAKLQKAVDIYLGEDSELPDFSFSLNPPPLALISKTTQDAQMYSEQLQAIIQPIQQLHNTKEHIKQSIEFFTYLHAWVQDIKLLEVGYEQGSYPLEPLKNAKRLAVYLRRYQEISLINKGLADYNELQDKLYKRAKQNIFDSFNPTGIFIGEKEKVKQMVMFVTELNDKYNEINTIRHAIIVLHLKEYEGMFAVDFTLENIPRRFAWYKKLLKQIEPILDIFPPSWLLSTSVATEFCVVTKFAMGQILQKQQPTTLKVEDFIKMLLLSIEYENQLAKLHKNESFVGCLSNAFEPFMFYYIDYEKKKLALLLEDVKKIPIKISDEDKSISLLSKIVVCFQELRQMMIQCLKMSNGKTFHEICKLFDDFIINVADALLNKCPKQDLYNTDDYIYTAYLINTLDFISNSTEQLQKKCQESASSKYTALIKLEKASEHAFNCIAKVTKLLMDLILNFAKSEFNKVDKRIWSTILNTGDSSPYAVNVSKHVLNFMPLIRENISKQQFFKVIADKIVIEFSTLVHEQLWKWKPISQVGAEQLLLDLQSLKNCMSNGIYPPTNDSNSAKFHRQTVVKCFQKSEVLLKIAMNHLVVADVFVGSFVMMTDVSAEGNAVACSTEDIFREKSRKKSLLRLLEFRGASKQEITKIIDKYTQLYSDTETIDMNTATPEDKNAQVNWKKLFVAPAPPVNPTSPLTTTIPVEQVPQQSQPQALPTATASFMNYFSTFSAKKQ